MTFRWEVRGSASPPLSVLLQTVGTHAECVFRHTRRVGVLLCSTEPRVVHTSRVYSGVQSRARACLRNAHAARRGGNIYGANSAPSIGPPLDRASRQFITAHRKPSFPGDRKLTADDVSRRNNEKKREDERSRKRPLVETLLQLPRRLQAIIRDPRKNSFIWLSVIVTRIWSLNCYCSEIELFLS